MFPLESSPFPVFEYQLVHCVPLGSRFLPINWEFFPCHCDLVLKVYRYFYYCVDIIILVQILLKYYFLNIMKY